MENGEIHPGTLLGGDYDTDVAVIQIEGDDFPYLNLGNSDEMEVGEWVISAGNPYRLGICVKKGVISGWREIHQESYLLTDLYFNPGELGGPLLNLDGEVIGMNFANTSSHQVYGISIPSEMISFIFTVHSK